MIEYGRKPARFHRTGGSRSVVVPKDFIEGAHLADGKAEWVLTDQGILLRAVDGAPAIEDDLIFAAFLTFLDAAAAKHPARLGDTVALTDQYLDLVEGVEIEADLPNSRPESREPAIAPDRRKGWLLLHSPEFETRFVALASEVTRLRERDPNGYREHPTTKLFAALLRLVRDIVPDDPNAARFRLEGALRKFRRAKGLGLPPRYRLFWVFSARHRTIVFLYLNDESTLRKEGAQTDPYEMFRRKVERGELGSDFEANFQLWQAAYPETALPNDSG